MSNLNNFLKIKKLCHRFKKRGKPKRKIAQGKRRWKQTEASSQ